MDRHGPRRRRARGDDGASLVEFALILPIFAMLMLGTITGGLAYNRKLAITASAREAVRFAATLAPPNASDTDRLRWAGDVHGVAMASADGELDTGDSGRYVCVALRIPSGESFSVTYDGASVSGVRSGQPCFTEDPVLSGSKVQVVTRRQSTFEAMVFSRDITLEFQAVSRYEAR